VEFLKKLLELMERMSFANIADSHCVNMIKLIRVIYVNKERMLRRTAIINIYNYNIYLYNIQSINSII